MDYREAIDYILKFADYERLPRSGVVWDLRRVERLLEKLGNPHAAAKTVHVAGTKGKGSTAAMLAAILKQAGYRVGLYTSPHLLSFTERLRMNGEPISEEDWARLTETLRPAVELVNEEGDFGELTTFEILTALAFAYFRDAGADYQVLETGMGGRLDATNAVTPQLCVITSISYDHTDVLGETLAEIAGEKAGIIKPGAAVVSAPQFPEAMAVIERVCREKGVRLVKAGDEVTWRIISHSPEGQRLRVHGLNADYDVEIPLAGAYQAENAAVAVAAAEMLSAMDAKITAAAITDGLARLKWPGRLQVLRREPWVVADGAHNAYSMQKLGEALKTYFTYNRLTLILGFSGDKNILGMADEAVKITGDIILVRSRHPRAVKAEELAGEFERRGAKPRVAESVAEAVKLALGTTGPDGLICAAGSLFVTAEVMEAMGD